MAKSDKRELPKPPVNDIYDIAPEALTQLKTWMEQSGLRIPASQLVGNAEVPAVPTAQDIADALVALGLVSQA